MPRTRKAAKSAFETIPAGSPDSVKSESTDDPTKFPDHRFEERPDVKFAKDFDPDLSFAMQWQSAIEMESEYEDNLERELTDEAEAEPWAARIMRDAWAADPAPQSLEDFGRFRMPADAFKAMNIKDPLEAMLVAQCRALHTNMTHVLRQATRLASLKNNPELSTRYYTLAIKLGTAFAKLMDTLQRYRTKGQQKVVVKYERQAGRRKTKGGISRSEKHRITVSKSGGLDTELEKPTSEKESVLAAARYGADDEK